MQRRSAVFNGRVSKWIAAMALLTLGLASLAAPVFAQVSLVNQNADQFGLVNDSVCSQVYNIAVQQYNAGDQNANANAVAGAVAIAGATAAATTGVTVGANAVAAAAADANAVNIANQVGISIGTVNACLNAAAGTTGGNPLPGGGTTNTTGPANITSPTNTTGPTTTSRGNPTVVTKHGIVLTDSIPEQKVLADTGGPLILLPALGLLLVTAGATMLRILLRR